SSESPSGPGQPPATPAPLAHPEAGDQTDLRQWLRKQSEWLASNSEVIQNSPAWRQVLEDLTRLRSRAENISSGPDGASLAEKVAGRVGEYLPSERFWNDSVLSKVSKVPLPSVPNIKLPSFSFPKPSMPSVGVPSVSTPGASGSRSWVAWMTVVAVALLAVVVWKLYQLHQRPRAPPGPRVELDKPFPGGGGRVA